MFPTAIFQACQYISISWSCPSQTGEGSIFFACSNDPGCNVSGAAIHQRIQKLTNLGILKGSEYVIDPEKVGYETCAYIGIYLKDPESFDSVTKALEAIPEVVECHFTTGKYDMFIKIYAKNNHHLLSIIHDKLQPLGLARTETLISFHEAIKRQMPIMVDIEDED